MNDLPPQSEWNRIIAERCGWRKVPRHADSIWGESAKFPEYSYTHQLPNYITSLDVMREAEQTIGLHDKTNSAFRVKWANTMRSVVGHPCSDVDMACATSLQRAEAFILTTNPTLEPK